MGEDGVRSKPVGVVLATGNPDLTSNKVGVYLYIVIIIYIFLFLQVDGLRIQNNRRQS